MNRRRRFAAVRGIVPLALVALVFGLAACASRKPPSDPLTDLQNPKLTAKDKEKAIQECWTMVQQGKLERNTVREELKTIAWSRHWPLSLRMSALNALLSDTDPAGQADMRNVVRLMLPREPEIKVIELLSKTAADRGWKEVTPSLVRSLSQPQPGIADRDRPEAAAIRTLNPDQSLERVVYGLFLSPPEEGGAFGLVPAERVRMDAWNLLARLDQDGTLRAKLITEDEGKDGPAEDIRVGLHDLRVIPVTGEELEWLTSLRAGKGDAYQTWWEQTTAAVAKLDRARTGKLELRHLEPIRWASVYRTSWLAAGKEQLLTELKSRLDGRKIYTRSEKEGQFIKYPSERLRDWQNKLAWGDVLAILVIDESLKQKDLIDSLFAQAEMDRDDRTAEYGGLIRTGLEAESTTSPAFSAVLYPPRPGSRRGDKEFVASTDMLSQGDHALAHYHFHVQDTHNGSFAGPSLGDLNYARRYGRMCVVFTSVSGGILDADVYSPDGEIIDLGGLSKP